MTAAPLVMGIAAGVVLGFMSWAFVIVELIVLLALVSVQRRVLPVLERWDRGASGEEHVGAILDGLREDGWYALHDISFGRGNIDHVLIGPGGVLTVESKSHGGRIDTRRLDQRMLNQAYAQAKLLSQIVGREVAPLLVFSRAFLHPRPVSRHRGVVVLPARMLKDHLARRRAIMSAEDVQQLHRRLVAGLPEQG